MRASDRWVVRLGSVMVALAVAASADVSRAEPGAVLYAQDFDGVAEGALPPGWNAVVGSWGVRAGRLVGQAGAITRITFGPHAQNFLLEATVRFESVTNSSRWLAPVLDIAPTGGLPWWQAAMRTTTTASNGLEFAERTAANTWSVPYAAAAPSPAGIARDVHLAIAVQGPRATWFLDGEKLLEGTIRRSPNGVLGFTADGAQVAIDDVLVTELPAWSPVLEPGALPATIAHRGYSAVTPENTLAAYAAAMAAGADYVEIDVQTTADGVPVVMHDKTIHRTTDGTGEVSRVSSAYMSGLEAGSWFSPAFADQPAPTLAQILDLMRTGAASMLLEIKGPETQAEVFGIVDMVTARGLASRVLIQSFDAGVLQHVRERTPEIAIGLLRSSLDEDPVSVARDLGVSLYNPTAGALLGRPGVVSELNAAGIAVFAWTVDGADQWKELTAAGVDGIITNRPGAFIGWKEAQLQPAALRAIRALAAADAPAVRRLLRPRPDSR